MLSTSTIKNAADAAHYYSATDNYYTREEGMEQSEWLGKGAEKLQLQGEVNPEQFTLLLKGKLPNGEQLGKAVNGEIAHRAGWDLTFSAPKSVSILALIGGDKRLVDAHQQAVKIALSEVERSCSEARVKLGGQLSYHNTRNMVSALYHHDLSRDQDPQLHTHSVVMNITERQDGKWRSQASKIGRYDKETSSDVHGFIERVRNNKRYFGKLYEAELAYQVKELGYEIEINSKTGVFEIVGVEKDVLQFFSKRSEKIKQSLDENGLSGSRAADFAARNTRENKKEVDRGVLTQQWKDEASNRGLHCAELIEKSQNNALSSIPHDKDTINPRDVNAIAFLALKQAGNTLSEFNTTFSLEDVVMTASSYAIRENINVKSLLQAADYAIQTGEFISITESQGKTLFMAKATLDDEKRITACINQTTVLKQKVDATLVNHFVHQHEMVPEIQQALTTIFSDQRYVLVEGNKSSQELPNAIARLAKSAGLEMSIVSPNKIISKQLAARIKPQPQTLWENVKALFVDTKIRNESVMQLLANKENAKSPHILMIDHSHLLSAKQTADLLEWGKDKDTQMIFLSQKNLLLSQKTGVSTEYLIKNGITTVSLAESQNTIAHSVSQLDMSVITQKIAHDIQVVANSEDRQQTIAKQFSRLPNVDRVFMIANNKKSVENLNRLAHSALKDAGKLGKGMPLSILLPQFLSEHTAKQATAYLSGSVVRFNEDYKSLSIKRGEYLSVLQHNKKSNSVILKHTNGKEIHWNPDKVAGQPGKVELFKEQDRELCVGERVVFHRGLKYANLTKGEFFTVDAIRHNKVKLSREQGNSVELDLTKAHNRHFDYGYAATPHAIVHEKPSHIIAELPIKSFHTDQRRLFQMVSQAEHVLIYTDNLHALIPTLEKKTGNRLTAHETLKSSDEIKQNLHAFYEVFEKAIVSTSNHKNMSLSRTAIDAVNYSIQHLSEREAAFTHKELMFTAMKYALGEANPREFTDVALAMEKAGISLRGNKSDGTLWTTLDAVNSEREILALCIQDKGKLQPIASDEVVKRYCDPEKLHPEQIAAIKTIVQSTDRVLSIQGRAGTGKTTLMATLDQVLSAKDLLLGEGYTLQGIAPTHKAIKELRVHGIPACTIDRFLLDMRQLQENKVPHDFSKTVLVIDEASMVSNDKMLEVLKIAHTFNFREAIPTGDTPQLAAIEAGKPHALIQRKIDPILLQDIRRQKNPTLKEAVQALYKGDIQKTFSVLKDSIIEISEKNLESSYQKRIEALVSDYISLRSQGDDVQIIAPSHDDRRSINNEVRSQLAKTGFLTGDSYLFSVLSSTDMTRVERTEAINFKPDQIIRFIVSSGRTIKAGEYFVIKSIDKPHNVLILNKTDGKGEDVIWQIPKSHKRINNCIEVFKKEERTLKVGDKIVWVRTSQQEGTIAADYAEVRGVDKGMITVKRADNSLFTFNGKDEKHQHWDHAYAITAYGAQGGTYSTVLALFESYRPKLMNLKTFLVTLTRPINELRIYTDDKDKLKECISNNPADKSSSLEVIGEYPSAVKKQQIVKEIRPELSGITQPKYTKSQRYDIKQIVAGMNQDAERIATDLLGKPKTRTANYLQFGSHSGSLRVTINGAKQGLWNDFSGERTVNGKTGGNMLQFIEVFGNMSKKESIQYAARQLGMDVTKEKNTYQTLGCKKIATKKDLKQQQHSERKLQQSKINFARKLAAESEHLKGTIVEKYLTTHRGIEMENYPDDVRYHPGIYSKINDKTNPAMLVIARDKKGNIQAVQATYLDKETAAKIGKSIIKIQKQTFGVLNGTTVNINSNKGDRTLIAEGTETGLSLAKAMPNFNVKVTLGKSNLLHLDTHYLSKNVTLCVDNDGQNIKEDKLILEAAKRLIESGKEVRLAIPTALHTKQDYNDIIREKGTNTIVKDIKNAVSYAEFYGIKSDNKQHNAIYNAISYLDKSTYSIDHKALNTTVSLPISSEKIQSYANRMSESLVQNDKKNIGIYRSLIQGDTPKTIDKPIEKQVQVEREI
jgi:conjugative relaxase-like TrwC/TraI family protein